MAIRGFVEAIAEHEIRGWAFDEDQPDGYVSVLARLNGTPIGLSVNDVAVVNLSLASAVGFEPMPRAGI